MKRYGKLFERVIDFKNMLRAFQQASSGKKERAYVNVFFAHLEKNIFRMIREMEAQDYRWSKYYIFEINDRKKRMISAPVFRDRIVHHAICNVINPIFDKIFIEHSYACRAGKGTLAAVKAYEKMINHHPELICNLKCDIRRYFPSIAHRILFHLIQRKTRDKRLLHLLKSLIFTEQGKGIS